MGVAPEAMFECLQSSIGSKITFPKGWASLPEEVLDPGLDPQTCHIWREFPSRTRRGTIEAAFDDIIDDARNSFSFRAARLMGRDKRAHWAARATVRVI